MPVPARIGDPSTIKHVFLLVKENRTYDQVYGDMTQGNGDPTLAQFGAKVTPNQHALAKQFGLYDNTYDVGTNSAEGHNWLMQGDNPEYTESSAGEYQRSYDTEEDVLGHQRSGFLWTAVEDAGNTARNYGEFEYTEGKPAGGTWQQYYCAAKGVAAGGDPAQLTTPNLKGNYGSVIPSLNAIANPLSPPFDTSVPDLYRVQIWKQDFEKNGPANLNMMWLSSDHTGGPVSPRAQVADGDLAVGQIVDEISHSQYWKDSAIFVVEDDSQDGADHVDGHRAPVQIISPWAQHGDVDSTYYSQITMVRTIEQILGAQPLNEKLAAATPMDGAFTSTPDMTPFTAVPNQVSLTESIATAPACGLDTPPPTTTTSTTTTVTGSVDAGADGGRGPAGHRRRLEGLADQAEDHRQRRGRRLREPGADEPVHVVRRRTTGRCPTRVTRRSTLPADVPGAYIPSPDQQLAADAGGPRARDQQVLWRGRRARRRRPRHRGRARCTAWSDPTGPGRRRCSACCSAWPRPTAASWRSSAARCAGRSRCRTGSRGSSTGRGCIRRSTARQNLAALARLRGDGADGIADALDQVGLTDVADDRVRGFSLGMRQRLGLAAALLTRPRLLVLDEPANGLDPIGTRHVHRVLTRLAAHGTRSCSPATGWTTWRRCAARSRCSPRGRVVFSGPIGELAADADELDYRLRTSDAAAARRVAADDAGRARAPGDDLLQRQDAEALLVRASVPALDELVARLVGAGVGVRELAPVVAPLEAAFLALTAPKDEDA